MAWLMLLALGANAENFRVAFIDAGYNPKVMERPLRLCTTGHYDFKSKKKVVGRINGTDHGSFVASAFLETMKTTPYCAVIITLNYDEEVRGEMIAEAVDRAVLARVHAINISVRGSDFSYYEYNSLERASRRGIMIFVAVGNDRFNLDEACNVYPACYELPNLIRVGALESSLFYRANYSNYGSKVKVWMSGDLIIGGLIAAKGTSFAAPRAMGDYLHSLSRTGRRK